VSAQSAVRAQPADRDNLEALFQFMPYGAPELKEVARKYMFRGVLVGSAAWILLFLLTFGTSAFLRNRPHETSVVVVPYRELAAPPPLTEKPPPPAVAITQPVAPPTVAVPVPVPDAEAPPEQTIATQEELAAQTPGVATEGEQMVVAPPTEDELPKFGEYVYVEELPEAVSKVQPLYPDLAREAGVDGTVMVQALVGKDGKIKDTKVVKSIPMLDQSAVTAVRQWVFKPALSNNKPVAVWVAVPVKFSLH
jgi:periplasmic protein TonB